MKRKYKHWIIGLLEESVLIFILNKAGIHFDSLIITFLFLLPVVVLFVLLSKDEAISTKGRALCKFAYCFISFCYLLTLSLKLWIG